MNGLLDVLSELAWMGCTVSFICCEDEFLQMPLDQHVEKKKEERKLLSKVCKPTYVVTSMRGQVQLFYDARNALDLCQCT